MAELADQPADNDPVQPWNVRESILAVGRSSATALRRWEQALNLNNEVADIQRRRGASAHQAAGTRFHNYYPLLELGRLDEADQLLRDCQDVYTSVGDTKGLGRIWGARAHLEMKRGHVHEALELERTALRLAYVHPHPHDVAGSHHNLDNLSHSAENPAEQRAHRLAATLLYDFTGDTHHLTYTLGALVNELRDETNRPGSPALPTSLPEIIRLIDAGDGIHFGDLVAALHPDPDTADRALADLLATAAALVDLPATTDNIPTELTDTLDKFGAIIDWAVLGAALHYVLAGKRDRKHVLASLDDIHAAILAATLDRFPTDPAQDE